MFAEDRPRDPGDLDRPFDFSDGQWAALFRAGDFFLLDTQGVALGWHWPRLWRSRLRQT